VAEIRGDAHDFTTSSVEAKHLSQAAPATLEVHAYRKRTLLPDHLLGSGAVQLHRPGSGQKATVELRDKARHTVGIVEFSIAGDDSATPTETGSAVAGTGLPATTPGASGAGHTAGTNPSDSTATAASVNAANTAALSEAKENKNAAQSTRADLAAEQARAKTDATASEARAKTDATAAEATAKTNATADQAYNKTADTVNTAEQKLQGWKEGLLEKQAEARDKHTSPAKRVEDERTGTESVPPSSTTGTSAYNSAIGIPPEAGHVSDAPGASSVSNTPVDYATGGAAGATSGAVAPTGAGAVISPGSGPTAGTTSGSTAAGQGPTWGEKLRGVAVGAIDKTAEALEAAKIHLTGREAGTTNVLPAANATPAPGTVLPRTA
jgi:cell division septum initiation protein DivIVA